MSFYQRLFAILFFQLVSLNVAFAQALSSSIEEYEENLSEIFSSTVNDTVRVATLLESLEEKKHEFADITINYIQKGIDLTNKLKLTDWEAEFYDKLGWTYVYLSQKDNFVDAFEKSLTLFRSSKNTKRELDVLHMLIRAYAVNNAADKALSRAYDALEICSLTNDENCLGETYFLMATTMYNFNENAKGIEFSQKAAAIFEKSDNTKKLAECYAHFSEHGSNGYDVSLGFLDKSLDILKKDTTSSSEDLARIILSRLRLHNQFLKYEATEKDLNYIFHDLYDDLQISRQQNLDLEKGVNKFNLGKYEESIQVLKENINSPLADVNTYLDYNYEYLVKCYEAINQLDSAYHYHMLIHDFDAKNRIHESKMKMADLEAQYEDEKKQLMIASQNQTIAKQKTIQWLALGAALLLGLLLFQTYRNGQQRRKANEQLIKLDHAKTRLYTNITHEFRTPLTVILGMAAQVQSNPSKYLTSGTELIQKNGERLMELINQMLDLNKLESGAMTLNNVQSNIIEYISYLSQSVESFADSKKIKIHFIPDEEELMMDYDEEILKTIFTNLFSNSIKFTPEAGNIYIKTRKVDDGTNPALKINFKDTGEGILEEELPFVFDRFYQADDGNTRAGEGTGIGLAIVKEYVILMGGEIAVKSKFGKETEFEILLPISRKANLNEKLKSEYKTGLKSNRNPINFSENSPDTQQGNKATILLIEDNLDVATYITSCLDQQYNVLIGRDGKEGVEMALHYIPDIVITDIMMPIKDGFEVCQELKTHQLTSHIPLIMLTAKTDYTSKLEGLKYGADAYLEKPFNQEELKTRLLNLLSSRDNIQQHYLSLTNLKEPEQNSTKTSTLEDEFVIHLTQIVSDHLSDPDFSVELFAKKAAMSSSQFHRKISGVTGLSPNRFIRHIRLTKAKELLRTTDRPINIIAFENGFQDPGYFGRVFKKEFGKTPLQWRQSVE